MTQPTLTNLHPNELTQGLRYYPLAVNLDRCDWSCNTLNDTSGRICVPKKTEDVNLGVTCENRNKWIKNINKTCIVQM